MPKLTEEAQILYYINPTDHSALQVCHEMDEKTDLKGIRKLCTGIKAS